MIVCVDVDYRDDSVVAAGVGFDACTDATCAEEVVVTSSPAAAPYEPGRFYQRELPYVTGVLALLPAPTAIVIDGFVWLAPGRAGLGAHLYDALDRRVAVIGVAKNPFVGAQALEVVRGGSARPLYVTAEGIDPALAAEHVRAMHGAFRIPTLLQRVDQLARGIDVSTQR